MCNMHDRSLPEIAVVSKLASEPQRRPDRGDDCRYIQVLQTVGLILADRTTI